MRLAAQGDQAGVWLELAKGADIFIEQHQDHSCVPEMDTDSLLLMVGMYKFHCLDRAGVDVSKEDA